MLRSQQVGEIDNDIPRSDPIDIPQKEKKEAPMRIRYHQLRFISDRVTNIECGDCGFFFNRTIESEVKDHSQWHRDHTRGNHYTKGFLSKPLWEENDMEGFVHRIQVNRRGASLKEREWYENALSISMKRGLDGPFTNSLWRDINDPSAPSSKVQVPRYKIYVYTIGIEVISVILAERISQAGAYYFSAQTHDKQGKLANPDPSKLQEYVNIDRLFPVMLSVDRLWTESKYQRQRFATKLLDHIRQDFIPYMKLHKCQIAFSLPTSSGSVFATEYCRQAFPRRHSVPCQRRGRSDGG